MSEDVHNHPGSGFRTDPVYAVSTLSSLFTVCALAIDGTVDFRKDNQERAIEEIRCVLNMGAMIAQDVAVLVERHVNEKGGEK
jgi:hypothetical protein